MTRRNFLSALAALPVVGRIFREPVEAALPLWSGPPPIGYDHQVRPAEMWPTYESEWNHGYPSPRYRVTIEEIGTIRKHTAEGYEHFCRGAVHSFMSK